MLSSFKAAVLATVAAATLFSAGCSTAPSKDDRTAYAAEARAALRWFEARVPGIEEQIQNSAGYTIFPSVGQWGIIFSGGSFGRGTVNDPNGRQVGWGALNKASIGLQAGVQGFKMLMIFEDEDTFRQFRQNKLTGSLGGVAVVASSGGSGKASFTNGVATYQGANSGLMAGVNVAAEYVRFKPLGDED